MTLLNLKLAVEQITRRLKAPNALVIKERGKGKAVLPIAALMMQTGPYKVNTELYNFQHSTTAYV